MSQTLSLNVMLQGSADKIWEDCKHADKILCDLMPESFTRCEFIEGRGEASSIRVITMGLGFPSVGQVKERRDKVDDATKTLSYTVFEDNPRYSSCSAEMRFEPVDGCDDVAFTRAIWTAKYEPVGDLGPPEHLKTIQIQVFLALERAVCSKKSLTHTETIDVAPEAIWGACKDVDEILCKSMPQFFASTTMLKGHGEPGSIRVVKMGPAIQHVVTERMDLVDDATRKLGYTVLKGDPHYKYLSATMQFSPGPREGSTTAAWVASYVPEGDMGPPEHLKAVVVHVWTALAHAVQANPALYVSSVSHSPLQT